MSELSSWRFEYVKIDQHLLVEPSIDKQRELSCAPNTWINKSRDWHTDGVANKSPVWLFMSTNLQKIPVKISWHSDVWSTSYSDLSDASLAMAWKVLRGLGSIKNNHLSVVCWVSYGSVYAILHDHLSMRKLLSKWVPRLLTVDQKRQRVVNSERCLELFRRNKPNFLRRYVTMDETWIHHYTSESRGRQPSGLQSVRSVQSGQKGKCGPVRLWPQYFGMLMELC